jgi:hypothetical protein
MYSFVIPMRLPAAGGEKQFVWFDCNAMAWDAKNKIINADI